MELFANKESCCGCTACIFVCPHDAIKMNSDEEGFAYPKIEESLCTECGLCKEVCSFNENYDTSENLQEPDIYAAKHVDKDVRMQSSSGGLFTAISDLVLHKNGVVYGVALDENLIVRHERAVTNNERDRFKVSKYVQSDLSDIYEQVKKDIHDGKYVLFTGTPCQTSGLKSFLGNIDRVNKLLLTCDFVCRGVTSPMMWEEYKRFAEEEQQSKINEYYFRTKFLGYANSGTQLSVYENGQSDHTSIVSQIQRNLFVYSYIVRPSCHNCKYTNFNRPADITLADFWGVEKSIPEFYDDTGVSLIIVNTEKGQKIFDDLVKRDIIEYRPSNKKDASVAQHNLKAPSTMHPKRNEFWSDYLSKGYLYAVKKYTFYSILDEIEENTRLIMFGAGRGYSLIGLDSKIKDKIAFFIDNDPEKQKKGLCVNDIKYNVYSPKDALELLTKDDIIVVTSFAMDHGNSMLKELASYGIDNKIVFK